VNPLLRLAQDIEQQRLREGRAEGSERRDFQKLGLDPEPIMQARRLAAAEAMQRAMEAQRLSYQQSIPGINPTMLALRAKDQPMTANEAVAAGVYGVGWQQSPAYPQHQQLDLKSLLMAKQLNELTQGQPGPQLAEVVEEMTKTEPPKARSGRRMAMRWGLPAAGAGLGMYALAGTGQEREPVAAG
jgi:hypothetical protein